MKKLVKLFFIILVLSFTIYALNSFANTNELIDNNIVNEVNVLDSNNETSNKNNVNNVTENTQISISNSNNIDDFNIISGNEQIEETVSESMEILNYQDGVVKIDNVWRMVINGKIDYDYTGIGKNDLGTWLLEKGRVTFNYTGHYTDKNGKTYVIEKSKVRTDYTGVMKIDNIWRMVKNGVVDYNYTGIGTNEYGTWYVQNGTVTLSYTGTYFEGNTAHIAEGSKIYATVNKTTTEVIKINGIWRMVKNGVVDYNYTGIGKNNLGTWLVQNGTVTFKFTGIHNDSTGKYIIEESKVNTALNKVIKIDNIWRMVVKGKVDYNYTGIGTNENGTWYVEKGKVGFDYTGTYYEGEKAYIVEESKVYTTVNKNTTEVMKINDIWRMVTNGKVDYNYTGIGTNNLGTWLVQNGTIKFDYTGNYKDKNGTTYVVEENKVRTDYTGIIKVDNIWRMIVKGIVDYNYDGIGTNIYGAWYVQNGQVTLEFTGTYFEGEKAYIVEESKVYTTVNKNTTEVMKINDIWRMVTNGKVDYNYTGIGTNNLGTWLVQNGTIKFDYTGNYKDKNGTTYVVEENKVRTDYTGIIKVDNIWRMIVKGIVDYNYTGIGTNIYGTWYVQNGTVTLKYTGTYFEGDKAYIAEDSKIYATVTKNTTEVMKINDIWRMVTNGKVNYTYNGIGSNSLGIWILQNGTVNFAYTGEYKASDGSIYNAREGKVREVIKNAKHPGTMWVDSPVKDSKHSNNMISVSGWALSEETGDSIRIYLDDKYICDAPRKERPDVFETYPNSYGGIALNPQPGYEYNLNISNIGNGSHILRVVNIAKDKKTIIQSREVTFNIVRLEKPRAGIDVSKYQGEINWQAVKNSGVSFAILRIGYYKQSSNTVIKDPYFESYYNSCRSLGIAVGGYFYSYAFNAPEAAVEAEACLSIIRGKYFDMPIFLDVEDDILKRAIANGTTNVNELTNASITFCDTMIRNGYQAGVYASKNFFETYLNAPVLERYNIWLAHYTSATDYKGKYDIWQYTSQGTVPGINGPVDLDWSMKKFFNRKH